MDLDKETKKKIQELQLYEQNLQGLSMQKQAFLMELTEVENALSEIKDNNEPVFKVVGQIMVKTDKKKIDQELKEKKDLINLRINSIEKQESLLNQNIDKIKAELMKKIK